MRALFFLLLFDQTIQQVTLSRSVTQSKTSIRRLSDNRMPNFKLRGFKQREYWPQFKLQVYPAILNKYVRVYGILLALVSRRWYISFVYPVCNFCAHAIVAISRENGPWPGQQAKVMEKYVPLFNPVLQEKTMSQRNIANRVPNL